MHKSLSLFSLLFFTLSLFAQDTTQQIVAGRKNAPQQMLKPYVILISADGFRYDYAEKFNAKNLQRLSKNGVRSESMIPVFPSKTYPNHYTLATGLYPAHHGIVHNDFYDRKRNKTYKLSDRKAVEDGSWYGGTPVWVLAEQQKMLTASYFFIGTEAPIRETYSSYWYRYNERTAIDSRINQVISWLKNPPETRPHLISFYLSEVDYAGHAYGPDAKETRAAVEFVDRAIGSLTQKVEALGLPVSFIFLADHGMAYVDTVTRININKMIDTSLVIIRGSGSSLNLYVKNEKDIMPLYNQLKAGEEGFVAYLKKDIPDRWHHGTGDDVYDRIGDILIVSDFPKVLSTNNRRISPGDHGFDPELKEMHAAFYAWGAQIREGITIPAFGNIHVYPLICKLLGLKVNAKIDGDLRVLEGIIK